MKYTKEVVARIVEVYTSADSVDERRAAIKALSLELALTPKMIQGKLVSEKVWVKSEIKAKSEKSVSTKESLITALSILMGVDTLTSLKNASIKDLTVMVKAMNKRNDQFDAK
jgi:hypothetical protein